MTRQPGHMHRGGRVGMGDGNDQVCVVCQGGDQRGAGRLIVPGDRRLSHVRAVMPGALSSLRRQVATGGTLPVAPDVIASLSSRSAYAVRTAATSPG
jgi:hypothetical protein